MQVSVPFTYGQDHTLIFGTTCAGCEQPFAGGDRCVIVRPDDAPTRQWHVTCHETAKQD